MIYAYWMYFLFSGTVLVNLFFFLLKLKYRSEMKNYISSIPVELVFLEFQFLFHSLYEIKMYLLVFTQNISAVSIEYNIVCVALVVL